jgi:hypothetical protein
MTIFGEPLRGPATTRDWLILAAILAVVFVTMRIAAGVPAAILTTGAAGLGYVVDLRFFLPMAVVLVAVLAAAFGPRPRLRPGLKQTAREGSLVGAGLLLYEFGRASFIGEPATAHANAVRVMNLERHLGLAFEPALQRLGLERELVLRFINGVYSWGYLSFVVGALLWLFVTDDTSYRYFRTSLGVSAGLAVVTIALFPVAPPRLVPTSGQIDSHGLLGHGHSFVNQFAAVPSLHVGWTALAGFMLWHSLRGPLGWFLGLVPVTLMTITVIVTGNHYWFDGLVGIVLSLIPAVILIRGGVGRRARDFTDRDRRLAQIGSSAVKTIVASPWTLFSMVGLGSLLLYLLVREAVDPGFTNYWGYMVFQIAITIAIVLILSVVFAPEGGLSWYTHLVVTATTWFDTLGTAGHMYDRYDVYDKITHFAGGVAITAVAANIFSALTIRGVLEWSLMRRLVTAVALSVAIGGIWEIYEYFGDVFFSTGRHAGSLDTIYDLISDTIGSLVSAVLIWRLEPVRTTHPERAAARANRALRG